ncbi:MAG TPA: DUF4349 domain-containing protein [Spirochaetota bacterium]|nr:DUF4349 domain-containing protein [Spirochaetota bacterium]HQO01053.1 DUF4349 domain-containing protein [Spirochaetota bacterium]HQP47483.1 DUF4349 domain-containing protein [Spirochaetota bacterium]
MKRIGFLGISLFFIIMLFGGTAFSSDAEVIFNYRYSLTAGDPDAVIESLRDFAKRNGGYVKFFSNNRIDLRLPKGREAQLKADISRMGYVSEENQSRQDVSKMLLDLKTQLKVKKKLLHDLKDIFSSSQLSDTLSVEQELGKVIVEVESIKGQMFYYRDRVALPEIQVYINRSSGAVTKKNVDTRWEWIRKMGIHSLIQDF